MLNSLIVVLAETVEGNDAKMFWSPVEDYVTMQKYLFYQ